MISIPERSRTSLAIAAIILVTAMVYWPGRGGGFVFDDFPNIVGNIPLHVTGMNWNDWIAAILSSPSSATHRPLAMLTFAMNHYFTGLDPQPMKLTNIAVHLINTLLVFGLMRSVFAASSSNEPGVQKRTGSAELFATASWALHPINVMAVLFIVQRMESLCHMFVFAGLWAYVAGRSRQRRGSDGWHMILGGLIAGTALGLLAKESAVLLPLYALCVELCIFRFRDSTEHRDQRLYWLFSLVLVVPAILGMAWLLPKFFQPGAFLTRDFTMAQRLMTEPRVVLDYLHWIVVPDLRQFGLDHDDFAVSRGFWNPPSTVLAMFGIAALLASAAFLRRRRPLVALGILWFLSAQLLTATFIPFELAFEHRNYFASLGICMAISDLLFLAPTDGGSIRRPALLVAVVFLLVCAGTTFARAQDWANPVMFASTEAARHPQSPRATYALARTLIVVTNYDRNSPLVDATVKALTRARQVPHNGVLPYQASLIFAARMGEPIDITWWRDMQTKLREQPIGPQEIAALESMTDCVISHSCNFGTNEMLASFFAAMSHGDDPGVLHVYGNYVLNTLNDDTLAMRVWKQASDLAPNQPEYRASIIKLLIAQGHFDQAREDIARLRELGSLGQTTHQADVLVDRLQQSMRDNQAKPRPQ